MEMNVLVTAAYATVMALFLGYLLLDGFDLGVGLLLPFVRDSKERARLISHIAPFWDGNEVWLVMGSGFLFASFPALFGLLLSRFYLPLMALVAAYILRAVALEFSYHDLVRNRLWQNLFSLGSALIVIFGFSIATALLMDHLQWQFLLFGLSGFFLMLWYGLLFALSKGNGEPLLELGRKVRWVVGALSAIITIRFILEGMESDLSPFFYGAILIYWAGFVLSNLFLKQGARAFGFSALMLTGLWCAYAVRVYSQTLHAGPAIQGQWVNLASPLSILFPLLIAAWILIPIILFYTRFVYQTFRKTVQPSTEVPRRTIMKEFVICKSCGFVMEKDSLKEVCPACGVPARLFEPYNDRLSFSRRLLLKLDIHPILVHFPQAFTGFILLLVVVLFLVHGPLHGLCAATLRVVGALLPVTVLLAFAAGLLDGKIRFRKVTTPLLIRKMIFGGLFFLLSCGVAGVVVVHPAMTPKALALIALLALPAMGSAAYLGFMGVSLLNAKFPG